MTTLKTDSTHKWELHEFDRHLLRDNQELSPYERQLLEEGQVKGIKECVILYDGKADQVTEEMASEWVDKKEAFGMLGSEGIHYNNMFTSKFS